jgi:O-antigen/teichoic acid export membrane protein
MTNSPPTLRRAAMLMIASSFLVPAAGLLTAPVLARALSTDGRGEFAAALAPSLLMLAAATLGLPDALTYHLAKQPRFTREALKWSTMTTLALGVVCLAVIWLVLDFLSGGSRELSRLIMLAAAFAVPALVINVFRGAATGRQMWNRVAAERIVNAVLRVVGFGLLFVSHDLTVLAAVLVGVVVPIVAGVVYWPLLRRSDHLADIDDSETEVGELGGSRSVLSVLVAFGSKIWLGSVASMLLNRIAPLLMTPLSTVEDLGLYSVATTISDVPLIVALAVQGALFGVNSKARDAEQITGMSRLTLLAGLGGCIVMGSTLPFWIGPLFGREFLPALVPTLILLASALVCMPGLSASTGLSAWGRPGLRSIGLAVTLVANLVTFVLLVPTLGVYGACWTSLVSNLVFSVFTVLACRRIMNVTARSFFLVRASDVRRAWHEGVLVLRRFRPATKR